MQFYLLEPVPAAPPAFSLGPGLALPSPLSKSSRVFLEGSLPPQVVITFSVLDISASSGRQCEGAQMLMPPSGIMLGNYPDLTF